MGTVGLTDTQRALNVPVLFLRQFLTLGPSQLTCRRDIAAATARDESGRFRSDGGDANYFERASVTGTTSPPSPALCAR